MEDRSRNKLTTHQLDEKIKSSRSCTKRILCTIGVFDTNNHDSYRYRYTFVATYDTFVDTWKNRERKRREPKKIKCCWKMQKYNNLKKHWIEIFLCYCSFSFFSPFLNQFEAMGNCSLLLVMCTNINWICFRRSGCSMMHKY